MICELRVNSNALASALYHSPALFHSHRHTHARFLIQGQCRGFFALFQRTQRRWFFCKHLHKSQPGASPTPHLSAATSLSHKCILKLHRLFFFGSHLTCVRYRAPCKLHSTFCILTSFLNYLHTFPGHKRRKNAPFSCRITVHRAHNQQDKQTHIINFSFFPPLLFLKGFLISSQFTLPLCPSPSFHPPPSALTYLWTVSSAWSAWSKCPPLHPCCCHCGNQRGQTIQRALTDAVPDPASASNV